MVFNQLHNYPIRWHLHPILALTSKHANTAMNVKFTFHWNTHCLVRYTFPHVQLNKCLACQRLRRRCNMSDISCCQRLKTAADSDMSDICICQRLKLQAPIQIYVWHSVAKVRRTAADSDMSDICIRQRLKLQASIKICLTLGVANVGKRLLIWRHV